MLAVVKIGTTSLMRDGKVDRGAVADFSGKVASAKKAGHSLVVVSSGAIAAGMQLLSLVDGERDMPTLQAVSAVGQPYLMQLYREAFSSLGLECAQVLMDPYVFGERSAYLQARSTMQRLLSLGVVPVVNENDAVSDAEIRFGENDTLAALVANLIGADLLLILTDTAGLFNADPREYEGATLIDEVRSIDDAVRAMAGGSSSKWGSGGMATKLAAARIAMHSGLKAVIADSQERDVVARVLGGEKLGTLFLPSGQRLPAKKLWIAFAARSSGEIVVDKGAGRALRERGKSLLFAGVVGAGGQFKSGEVVEVREEGSESFFAKGIARFGLDEVLANRGKSSEELPPDTEPEVIHRDDLVVLDHEVPR